jgi:hypothetical protein
MSQIIPVREVVGYQNRWSLVEKNGRKKAMRVIRRAEYITLHKVLPLDFTLERMPIIFMND